LEIPSASNLKQQRIVAIAVSASALDGFDGKSTRASADSNKKAAAGSISEPGQDETTSDEEMADDNAFGTTHSMPEADAFAVEISILTRGSCLTCCLLMVLRN
jgi:hypothetical protein